MDDREVALRWLEREGWDVDSEGSTYIATHPDAGAVIRFGGRLGWSLKQIRLHAARAMGHEVRFNRKRAAKQFAKAEAARAERSRELALAASIRAERARTGTTAVASAALLAHAAEVGSQPGWRATHHAAVRMAERGITRPEVIDTLRHPVDVCLDRDRPVYARGDVLVVVDAIDKIIVTVYRGTLAQHRDRIPRTTGP